MKSRPFGKAPSGEEVHVYTLAGDGIEVEIINYGGFITSLKTPELALNVAQGQSRGASPSKSGTQSGQAAVGS